MQIVTIQSKSFKNLPDGQYDLSERNIITGKNGAGKSSIADLIIFTLYGRTRHGGKEIDKLIRDSEENSKTALQFDTGTTVVRENSRFYGATILLNGKKITQKDLDVHIPQFDIFASVFMIGYFGTLKESDQRELMLALTPDTDLEKLFNEFTRDPELLEKYPIDFERLDQEAKHYKSRLKDIEQKLDRDKMKVELIREDMGKLKQPKKEIDVAKLEQQLKSTEDHAEYERILQHNSEVGKRAAAAASGSCSHCGQDLPENIRKQHLADITAEKKPQPDKPKGKPGNAVELRQKIQEAKINNALLKDYEDVVLTKQKEISDIEDENREIEMMVPELKQVVEALSPKGIRASEMRAKTQSIIQPLREHIENIDIQTLESLKTKDDYKEVFRIKVGGVGYGQLSTGERKRVDIALSKVIDELSGDDINMYYLDDAELLDIKDPVTGGQIFQAYVKANSDLVIGG